MVDDSVENKQKKTGFRKGLALTIYLWFILLSVGPVGLVGINEYREAKKTIISTNYDQLSTINLMLTQRVNDYFDTVITNLFIKAGVSETFIKAMVEGYLTEGVSASEYVNQSARYQSLMDRYSAEYVDFLRFYDYSDVILGDAKGNLLYTVNGYEDLGQNLLEGELSNTLFARAAKASLVEQQPKYSDLGLYPPVGTEKVSFFILPLTDDQQEAIGFIAVQIHANNIQTIFEQEHQLGVGMHSYLAGTDRVIRFGTDVDAEKEYKLPASNPLMELWLDHLNMETGEYQERDNHLSDAMDDDMDSLLSGTDHQDNDSVSDFSTANQTGSNHIRTYQNYQGETVLGIFLPVNVSGTPMAMVSEISQEVAFSTVREFRSRILYMISIVVLLVMLIAFIVSRRLVKPILLINAWVNRVASGDYVEGAVLDGNTEISELSRSFADMTEQLRSVKQDNEQRSWLQEGVAGLNESVRGEQSFTELCRNIVSYLAKYLNMQTGVMYVLDDKKQLQLMGKYAGQQKEQDKKYFAIGEGLVGQAALEQRIIELTNVPDDYLDIESGLGKTKPSYVIIVPLVYEGRLKGVIEFAYLQTMSEQYRYFLEHSTESIAIAINSARSRTRINQLLEQTTEQSVAMKEQQEELKTVNDELEKRARILEESEEEMRAQSEELQKSNVELEEKSEQLTLQKEEIEEKNRNIKLTSKKIADKAKELELASKYKSEFLANMSHELRTPLNSLLLLSQMLAANDEENLTEDQIESAQVIYNGGKELLGLINDILDLSKVEAGKMSVNLEDVDIDDVCSSIRTTFKPLAENRNLEFKVSIEAGATQVFLSDSQRLLQIMKNFLSNAFKFTEEGGVYVRIFGEQRAGHYSNDSFVGFSVRDTGIGIPKEKQTSIFESFQQADGSTNRKYGGTGLGLAISREMSGLLGGFIEVASREGKGTIFTLFLPDNAVCSIGSQRVLADTYSPAVSSGQFESEDSPVAVSKVKKVPKPIESVPVPKLSPMTARSMLLIEDDRHFIDILEQVAKKNHFEYFHARTGAQGLALAAQLQPAAIILDLGLPDMDGKQVLGELKSNKGTKDIPVHIISGQDPDSETERSSVGYLVKPVSIADLDEVFLTLDKAILEGVHHALILDLDETARKSTGAMLAAKGISVGYAQSADEAEKMLTDSLWQCLVMDIDLGDTNGLELLAKLKARLGDGIPSIVIQTARELDKEELLRLQEYTSTMVMKGDMSSERISDEVSLFLHSVEKTSPKVAAVEDNASSGDKNLSGHKLLLVDDDLRNTFALSKALQGIGLEVVIADNGQSALDRLHEEQGIELVLMDVMMPVMDGYEATRQLRKIEEFKHLPVISLTAKAMSDDRVKSLEAGANDYMTKPVDMDQLIEMLKVWLFK